MTEETKEVINVMKDMFDILNDKIGTLSGKMDNMQKDISDVKERLTNVENKVTNIETRVTNVENKVTNIETRVTNVENKVTKIELTLENETNPRIRALYDGYIANSEKLDKIEPVVDDVKAIKTKTDIIELAVKSHSHDINRFKRVK
jgi:predicted  nucleic acid-binding Zn-ribbon protein